MDRSIDQVLPEIIPYLKKICWKYMLQSDDVDDLVSDTCLKVLKSKDKFEGTENDFRAWCTTILKNIHTNNYRKKICRRTDLTEEGDIIIYSNLQKFSSHTDDSVVYSQLSELIKSKLSSLEYRIFMGFSNGFSYEQLSEILEIPIGTIKSRIFFTKKKLKTYIKV